MSSVVGPLSTGVERGFPSKSSLHRGHNRIVVLIPLLEVSSFCLLCFGLPSSWAVLCVFRGDAFTIISIEVFIVSVND